MKHIAIFASGKGSNAQAIIEYFANHPVIRVALVVSNNPTAGVVQIAHRHKIISAIVNNATLNNKDVMERLLNSQGIEFIALAGFLQMVPPFLLEKFSNKIVNIHPALLPKHGGKGMYGTKVHNAVLAAGDTETGMTIHYVNEKYDEGEVILQKSVAVTSGQTAEQLAQQVNELEHVWYPKTIENLLTE
jgi:phosphoribosylglycinamide formyltransferase 1